jgi:hypothetical protein
LAAGAGGLRAACGGAAALRRAGAARAPNGEAGGAAQVRSSAQGQARAARRVGGGAAAQATLRALAVRAALRSATALGAAVPHVSAVMARCCRADESAQRAGAVPKSPLFCAALSTLLRAVAPRGKQCQLPQAYRRAWPRSTCTHTPPCSAAARGWRRAERSSARQRAPRLAPSWCQLLSSSPAAASARLTSSAACCGCAAGSLLPPANAAVARC